MTIYDIKDSQGRVSAFEVGNMGRERFCKMVESWQEATLTRRPKFLSELREEEFCEFEFAGQKFRVWEPFGDNSRYWIGPEPPGWCEQTAAVRSYFERCAG